MQHGGREALVSAEIECFVDLDPAQKGVHMSRFPELFGEAIDELVIGEKLLVERLAEHIARHIVERQDACRAEVNIARALSDRAARRPVTGLRTQELVTLIGLAAATRSARAAVVGVEATGHQRLPVRAGARPRAGGRAARRGRLRGRRTWSGSSSSSRSRPTTSAAAARSTSGPKLRLDAEELVSLVERSMSSPDLRAPQAAGRAVRRRARAPLAPLRRGLGAPHGEGRARGVRRRSPTTTSSSRARSTSRRSTTTRCSPSASARSASSRERAGQRRPLRPPHRARETGSAHV